MTSVTIYSRPDCHLCDEMKAVVACVARSIPLAVREVDISGDPDLETRYGLKVPVLVIEGRKAAKYRVTEEDLRRILLARRNPTSTDRESEGTREGS